MNFFKLRFFDWILITIFTLSYISIDMKHFFYACDIWSIGFNFYNISPHFFNILCFLSSLFFIFKSNDVISKDKNIWEHILLLFLFINPFTWKNIYIPVNNLVFAISIFYSTLIYAYIKKNKYKKDILIPFYFLGVSLILINHYFIIYFFALASIDGLIDNKNKDNSERNYFHIFTYVFSVTLTVYYFFFIFTDDTIPDRIARLIENTKDTLPSIWGFILIFSLLGLLIGFIKSLKDKRFNLISTLSFLILVSFIAFSSLYSPNIFPLALVGVIGIFFLLRYAPSIGKFLTIITLLFSVSSFYAISDNYQKNMDFKEMIVNHIAKTYKDYKFTAIVGSLPESPEVKQYNFFPNTIIFNNEEKYQYLFRQKGLPVIFLNEKRINDTFNIYKSKKVKDFKYFSVYQNGKILYLYIKKPMIDPK